MVGKDVRLETNPIARVGPDFLREIRVIRGKGLLLLVLGALFFSAGRAAAQGVTPPGPVTDNDINRVAHQLYCPVCENTPLDVCPTQACAQWRATIGEKLGAGWTDQQILDYFVAQYGERVLARPSTHGLNVLVWVIPPLLVLGGAAVLWRFLGRVRPSQVRPAPTAPPPGAAGDEYAERLEQELRKRI
jgi:cytochrome c-type biogenesis protein CcmH